jgi:hypothetical protein
MSSSGGKLGVVIFIIKRQFGLGRCCEITTLKFKSKQFIVFII